MIPISNHHRSLAVLLWLVAAHSFLVGVGLIVMPGFLMEQLGYGSCAERFFRTQGGVFHIVMAIGYAMAASNLRRYQCLIFFAVVVKSIATLFLFSYALFVKNLAVIWLSGLADFIMAVMIGYFYRNLMTNPDGEA